MNIPFNFILFLHIIFPFSAQGLATNIPEGMIFIKGGCFKMGTDKRIEYQRDHFNDRERPVHEVCVDSFYMEKMEATQKEWETVMNIKLNIHNLSHHGDNLPMNRIRWIEAVDYCSRKGRRLPTEAEWEYSARAGTNTLNPWGDDIESDHLWFEANSVRKPHNVGTKKPNPWGLHDMIGSVWEWVSDWSSETFYKNSPNKNPKGPKDGSHHVIRGGSWVDSEKEIRAAVRYPGEADLTQDFLVGVRCAKDIKN